MTKTDKFLTPKELEKLIAKYGIVNKKVLQMEGFNQLDVNFKFNDFVAAIRRSRNKAPLENKLVNNSPKGDEKMNKTIENKKELAVALNNTLRNGTVPLKFQNALTRGGDGAVLIPEELKMDIEEAKVRNKSMRQYVDVIPVKAGKGYFSTEDEAIEELVEFGDSVAAVELSLAFKGVNFELKRYGSYTKVSEELFNDVEYDLTNLFTKNHSEKATKTENKLIFNAIKAGLSPKTLADGAALSTSLNKDLASYLEKEIVIVTNQDGFEKVKLFPDYHTVEKDGAVSRYVDIYPLEVVSNDDLASGANAPIIYGSFNRVVKLFTSNNLRVLVNKKGNGFLQNAFFLRGIEDYDVKLIPDSTELIFGEIPLV